MQTPLRCRCELGKERTYCTTAAVCGEADARIPVSWSVRLWITEYICSVWRKVTSSCISSWKKGRFLSGSVSGSSAVNSRVCQTVRTKPRFHTRCGKRFQQWGRITVCKRLCRGSSFKSPGLYTFSHLEFASVHLWLRRWSGLSTNPSSSSPHVDVFLGKILNPEKILMNSLVPCMPVPTIMCVNGWMENALPMKTII